MIVNLLDIHITPQNPDDNDDNIERLEIFEAGTGHGSLTLHLSRAIHGANTRPPKYLDIGTISETETTAEVDTTGNGGLPLSEEAGGESMEDWRKNRRAVVHTLDCLQKHSRLAEKTIKSFRNGLYYNNIDFHVGQIDDYISERLAQTNGAPFLDHAILDLPNCHNYMEIVCSALKPNGSLLVFCPSITQINTTVLHAKTENLPLYVETVIELGAGAGVGGREWDVRPVKVRSLLRQEKGVDSAAGEAANAVDQGDDTVDESVNSVDGGAKPLETMDNPERDGLETSSDASDAWELVCRPKVGVRTQGGGFVGQWRKIERTVR